MIDEGTDVMKGEEVSEPVWNSQGTIGEVAA